MKWVRNDFVIAFLIFVAYLLTNSYIYAWDDQHLEIPLLKRLIDPTLYQGDYYVEGLARNFSSYLYPILAKFISINQIPTVYLILFLIARYAMFFWVYRLWLLIGGSRFAAISATLMFFLLGRTEEFLYRTFSHQEFSYIFMFIGLYLFYRDRYFWAALFFGVGANFHAIYNLFPMLYLLAFLVFTRRFSLAVKSALVFSLAALPFLLWQIPRSLAHNAGGTVPLSEWMPLYLLSCPQNFLFADTPLNQVFASWSMFLKKCAPYVLLTALYLFHLVFNPKLRQDKKLHAIIGVSWFLIGFSYVFHYVHPSRFVLDLNLVRVEQFVRFFLMGYTTLWVVQQAEHQRPWVALLAVVLLVSLGASDSVALACIILLSLVFLSLAYVRSKVSWLNTIGFLAFVVIAGAVAYYLCMELKTYAYLPLVWRKFQYVIAGIFVAAMALYFYPHLWLRRVLIIIPIVGMLISYGIFHYNYLQMKAHADGFWQFQRNWQNMQRYVKDHTPKNALILTPYNTDLGGFRIQSERKVLVCYRDCGIIGFDYGAAVEWNKRVHDVEDFKVFASKPVDPAVLQAILKYGVDYVVFMNYYQPKGDNPVLKKLYKNEIFSLYQVLLKMPVRS